LSLAFGIDPPDLTPIEIIEISAVAPHRDHDRRAKQQPAKLKPNIMNA